MMTSILLIVALAAIFITFPALPSFAYVGPGMGLSALGSILAFVLAVIVAILGFLWYPIKRLLKKRKNNQQNID